MVTCVVEEPEKPTRGQGDHNQKSLVPIRQEGERTEVVSAEPGRQENHNEPVWQEVESQKRQLCCWRCSPPPASGRAHPEASWHGSLKKCSL